MPLSSITGSIVVCQGPVHGTAIIRNSIIFANGDITFAEPSTLGGCVIICSGSIETLSAGDCLLIAAGTVKLTDDRRQEGKNSYVIIENAREALGLVKFYDTLQAGIEVAEAEGVVTVKKVPDGKPFAKAGLREGDRVLAVNGTKIGDAAALRKVIRQSAMANKEAVFKVKRAEQTLELTVALTEK
jgi:membrane-associated protease RseP (regulator of RpoE activity)